MGSYRKYLSTPELLDDWRYWRRRALRAGPDGNAWNKAYQCAYWSWKFFCDRVSGGNMNINGHVQDVIEGRKPNARNNIQR